MEKDVHWENKHEFLNLPLDKLDKFNVSARIEEKKQPSTTGEMPQGKQFT